MNKNILITGGTGFVGGSLINSLKYNYKFINLGRGKSNLCENIYWDFKQSLNNIINFDIDTIIHCASIVGNNASIKSDYIDINVKSTLELLEFCSNNGVKKFIYISTGGVYGYNEKEISESNTCNPIDMYSLSKYFSEQLCNLYKNKFKIVILRLFFPYGNGQKGRLIGNLINNIIHKKDITLNRFGLPVINPVHIGDVVNILNKIIETECTGVFNVCGDECISIKNLCSKIASNCNIRELHYVYNDELVTNLIGSNKKICEFLNYTMEVNLDTAIKYIVSTEYKR